MVRLYNAGRILHIARCKNYTDDNGFVLIFVLINYFHRIFLQEKYLYKIIFFTNSNKPSKKDRQYEMRWAQPEDFMELSVMPRMLLDHLPENLEKAMASLLEQQKDLPVYLDST